MRISRTPWAIVLFSVALAGCAQAPGPLPAPEQVARIQVKVYKAPAAAGPKAPCEATFTKRADVTKVMDWLGKTDWSQEGIDLTVAHVAQPDGAIVVTTNAGATHDFSFYWDGGIILTKANRLLRGPDTAPLRQLLQGACK